MYQRVTNLSRRWKMAIVVTGDAIAILAALFLAIVLRVNELWPEDLLAQSMPFFAVMLCIGLPGLIAMGLHRIKLSHFDVTTVQKIAVFSALLGVGGGVLNIALELGAPRTVPAIFIFLFFCLSMGWKLAASQLLAAMGGYGRERVPIAVYGAGAAGIQLISTLNRSTEFRIVAVVDDNPSLRGVMIGGHSVRTPDVLAPFARNGQIERILLAMPSVSRTRRREIVERLSDLPVEVQTLPSYAEMVATGQALPDLRPVATDDLLGRDRIDLDLPGLAETYRGRSVLVSGAGGSIGSELCRQVLATGPRRLVLFERSEFALYEIELELGPIAGKAGVELVPVLGSVSDPNRVRRTLARYEVETVLHAAAYKHVPLVEANVLEGVRNNVFGTKVIAEAAAEIGVDRFILVSTDKAVRPANVMGATKRLAEMVVQDLARQVARAGGPTRFAMVRFGNVLGSSGSVIPRFRDQIAAGGPVTVTHPEVTRYFMTVPEAVRLVLLAGSYAEGGEVFVLDMGAPVKIMDLARRMIRLSGLTVLDETNPDGDIRIELTGLRPGEKLYEELLIDAGEMLETPHPKILCAGEAGLGQDDMRLVLTELAATIEADDEAGAMLSIGRWIEGYTAHLPASARVAAE